MLMIPSGDSTNPTKAAKASKCTAPTYEELVQWMRDENMIDQTATYVLAMRATMAVYFESQQFTVGPTMSVEVERLWERVSIK